MNTNDNALVLICREVRDAALYIRENDVRDHTIYANTQKLGLITGGYVRASEVLAALDDREANVDEPRVYVLTRDNITPPALTVVSQEFYVNKNLGAVSRSHCQPDRGGDIYNIMVSTYNIVNPDAAGKYKKKGTNKKQTKRNKGKKTKKSKQRKYKKTRKSK